MWIIGFSGNQPLLNRFGYFRIDHEAWYFCTAVTCSGERCFSNWLYFSLSHTAPSVFPFCFQVLCLNVWMLFTFSTSFASPCLLSHLGSSRTPFYAVDFLLYCCLFFFFLFFPHQHVYEHFAQDLLGCLEMEGGRVSRRRKIGICHVPWRGKKPYHLVDPSSVVCYCCWFPSPFTLR